jgi:urocanate hydratase
LAATDRIAANELHRLAHIAPAETRLQYLDNLRWIEQAREHGLVVGSKARILYADEIGRRAIASAFNRAISEGVVSAPIVLGRDHHDVGGTDSPYRETANIKDGSMFTADMSIQNFVGDAFRGATWVSLHNGGGVGWGEAINGGFGLIIDGSEDSEMRIQSVLAWDVNNGIARRAWARNPGSIATIEHAMDREPLLDVTMPNSVDSEILDSHFN